MEGRRFSLYHPPGNRPVGIWVASLESDDALTWDEARKLALSTIPAAYPLYGGGGGPVYVDWEGDEIQCECCKNTATSIETHLNEQFFFCSFHASDPMPGTQEALLVQGIDNALNELRNPVLSTAAQQAAKSAVCAVLKSDVTLNTSDFESCRSICNSGLHDHPNNYTRDLVWDCLNWHRAKILASL